MAKKKTFREVAEKWKAEKRKLVKRSTMAVYALALEKHLLPVFGERRRIVETEVQDFVIDKLRTHSRKSVEDMLIVLKMVYRYGVKVRAFSHEQWDINFPSGKERAEVDVLSIGDQKRLFTFISKNFTFRNLGIMICLSTGIRIGEMCALRWQDIDMGKRVISVSRTVERIYVVDEGKPHTELVVTTPKTKRSRREIPLSNELQNMITPLMKIVNRSYYILTNGMKPTEPRTYRNYYNRLLKQLDIPAIKFHGLRHSFATRCIESQCDYKTVSVLLGHASVGTTLNLYVHPNLEQKHKCISRMSRSLV